MKKNIVSAIVLLLSTYTLSAQEYNKGFRLGLGINGGFPTASDYEGSLGIDTRLQYDISRKTSMTLTSGYTHLFVHGDDQAFVPVKLGVKYFLGNQFYIMGEAGLGIGVTSTLDNTLLLAPAFGFANKYIDASIRYEYYNDYESDQIALRLAYGFSLKKKK